MAQYNWNHMLESSSANGTLRERSDASLETTDLFAIKEHISNNSKNVAKIEFTDLLPDSPHLLILWQEIKPLVTIRLYGARIFGVIDTFYDEHCILDNLDKTVTTLQRKYYDAGLHPKIYLGTRKLC